MNRMRVGPFVSFALILTAISISAWGDPTPPSQPSSGPGGYDYLYGAMTTNGPYYAEGRDGQDGFKYYLFEPAEPAPPKAPVVLFLHGYIGPLKKPEPRSYGAWIEHLVRKGHVVVFAQYQGYAITFPWLYARNATETWKSALQRLDTDDSHVRPARDYKGDYQTAIVGHSLGGYLAAILAAEAGKSDAEIPRPYAVVSIEPGGLGIVPNTDFSKMSEQTVFVIVVGNDDDVVCKSTAQFLWNETSQILDENRDLLFIQSDHHGVPQLTAGHYFPPTAGFLEDAESLDALDFYVTFKLSVAAVNCAYKGTQCEYAIGNGSAEQVNLGNWSDGQAVTPMIWIEDPNTLETSCTDPSVMGCCMPASSVEGHSGG